MLHSLNSHSPHLTPPIHQHWSWEYGYLDTFHDLPVQGVVVVAGHPHLKLTLLLSPLVVVHGMNPEHRIVSISDCPLLSKCSLVKASKLLMKMLVNGDKSLFEIFLLAGFIQHTAQTM